MTEQGQSSNGASSKDHCNILNSRLCRIRETNIIFKLLPFFEKMCIFRMLVSNTEINKKAAVLCRYIEKAVTQHHYINDNVFETLSRWQLNPNDSGVSLEENVNRYNDTRDLESCQMEEIKFIRKLTIGSYIDEDICMKYDQCKTHAEMEEMTIDIYTQSMLQTYDNQLKVETNCNDSEASSSATDCNKPINLAPVDVEVSCDKAKEVIFMEDEDVQIVYQNKPGLDTNSNLAVPDNSVVEDITCDSDEELWKDAAVVCEVVPNVELFEIYQQLKRLGKHQQKKLILIEKYLSGELPQEIPHQVSDKDSGKRRPICNGEKHSKRQKLVKSEIHPRRHDLNRPLIPVVNTVNQSEATTAFVQVPTPVQSFGTSLLKSIAGPSSMASNISTTAPNSTSFLKVSTAIINSSTPVVNSSSSSSCCTSVVMPTANPSRLQDNLTSSLDSSSNTFIEKSTTGPIKIPSGSTAGHIKIPADPTAGHIKISSGSSAGHIKIPADPTAGHIKISSGSSAGSSAQVFKVNPMAGPSGHSHNCKHKLPSTSPSYSPSIVKCKAGPSRNQDDSLAGPSRNHHDSTVGSSDGTFIVKPTGVLNRHQQDSNYTLNSTACSRYPNYAGPSMFRPKTCSHVRKPRSVAFINKDLRKHTEEPGSDALPFIEPYTLPEINRDVKPPSLTNEQVSTSVKLPLHNIDFGSLTNSQYRFLNDTNQYREYAMKSSHVEAIEYVRKFDIIKAIIPDSSDYDIASHVLCCKTEADLEKLVDFLLESNQAPVSQVKKEDDAPNEIAMSPTENEDLVQRQIITLVDMFTDADPDYINMSVQKLNGDQLAFENLVSEMIANPNYPKYEDYMKKKKENEMRQKFIEGMSMAEFLDYFDGNEEMFTNSTTQNSALYHHNLKQQIMQDYPNHLMQDIAQAIRKNYSKYLPSFTYLKKIPARRRTKRPPGTTPAEFDDAFLKERCYVQMLDKINAHKEQMENKKKIKFDEAKSSGELQECQCCCDDEVLLDDMSTCGGDPSHLFCNECIRRYSEEQIGQSKMEFACMEGECKAPFQLPVLKKVLKSSIFSNLLKRKQAEEIEAADIPDLVSCPFCNFATIMPNPEDKVFKCLNPECMKDSCRFCKERNHVPLKCEEAEKRKDVDHRTYLEDEMTKAIVRQCYKCKKAFLKEDGCNKMVCPCGAMSCYLCKQPIKGYDHFHDGHANKNIGGRCPLWSNSLDLHAKELKNRVEELKKDGTHENLVHNPLSAPVPQPKNP